MSSSEHNSINRDNSEIDPVIANIKQEFKNFLLKREQLIIKLGLAFERIVTNRESISGEIKAALREEIAQGLISRRNIERYCRDEWKKNTKPKKDENDKSPFSRQEQQIAPRVLVDAYGNSEIEPAATSDTDPNNVVNYEGPPNLENLCMDACPIRKELEDTIKKSTSFTSADQQFSEQSKVVELKTKIERLESDSQSKSDENSVLLIRIGEL